jgi:hypothetical protein
MNKNKNLSVNPDQEKDQIDRMEEYLNSKKEIFDFIINRNVFKSILFYFGIISIVFWLGGSAYIDHKIKARIDKIMSEKIDEECTYLSKRNKIMELGDLAISSGQTKYYEELKQYLGIEKQQRICNAAKAELLRIESYFFGHGDEYFPRKSVEYIAPDGKITKGYRISSEDLIAVFKKTSHFGEKTTILEMLQHRYDKCVPDFFLEVAQNTNNIRMRFIALRSLQILLDDFSVSRFDHSENIKLWNNNKENFYERVRKIKEEKEK